VSANANAKEYLKKLVGLSDTITSYSVGSGAVWPNVTMKNWDILTANALDDSSIGPELYIFAPIVPENQKKAWEAYAMENQGWIKDDLALRERGDVDPGEINEEIYAYNFDKESWQFVNFSLPIWQIGPVPSNADIIMMDLYTQSSFRRMVDDAYLVRHILLSEVVDRTFFWDDIEIYGSDPTKEDDPRSFAIQPVYDSFADDASLTGFLFAIIPWNTYFVDVLPYGIEGLVVQVNDTCGSNFAYLVNGPDAEYLSEGFEPDPAYDYLSETADFAAFTRFNEIATESDEILHCSYTISVHATSEYATSFETSKPLYLTLVVLTVFVFTAFVFVIYDIMVARRQKKVMRTAQKATAIVSSLFPKNVGNRLLAEAMDDDSSNKRHRTSTSGKDKLRVFFDRGEDDAKNGSGFDKPIADFFPDTTIMFGDIVGTYFN
jgi:hypothetical protein